MPKFWAERVRQLIANTPITIGKASISVSVSIGLTESSTTEYRLPDLVKNADSALYQAKQSGRNKVCCSEKMPHQVSSCKVVKSSINKLIAESEK